jgi:predicted lysophospholipase L1 biosynthesis ABC-type transport system permease subunit
LLQVLISTETAHALGMQPVPHVLLAEYAQPPGDDVVDALTAAAESTRITDRSALHVQVERGPASIDPVLWLISGVAMVLVIGAGTVCLGLARYERRAEDATLAAVGAGRGLRRRVEAWQAVIVVGLGTVIGSVAGLIPTWGISQMSGDYLDVADTPWLWLALLGIGLPLVMAAASWLIPPRSPDLTRRTAIA